MIVGQDWRARWSRCGWRPSFKGEASQEAAKDRGLREEKLPDLNKLKSSLKAVDPEMAEAIEQETLRQDNKIELIASENYTSNAVLEAQGGVLTNKYAEGYPGKRYYGGCEYVDMRRGSPSSAPRSSSAPTTPMSSPSQGRRPIWRSVCRFAPGATILGMDLSHGGHLSHGSLPAFRASSIRRPFTVSPGRPSASTTTKSSPWQKKVEPR